jgi:hypothetical protein
MSDEDVSLVELRDHQRQIMTWLTVLTVMIVLFGLIGSSMLTARFMSSRRGSLSEEIRFAASGATTPAAWGELIRVPINICPPLELLRASLPASDHPIVWYWPGLDSSSLNALLGSLKLSDGVRAELLKMARPEPAFQGLAMRPSREFVVKLNSSDRSELYTALSKYSQNADQGMAFRRRCRSPDDWLAGAPISDKVRKQACSLMYQRGSYWFFADLGCIESSFASPNERAQFLKAMAREPTYMLRLKVDSQSDVESLVRYWGREGREKDVRPLIEAMADIEGGGEIAVAYLLPPFARNRLCIFPVPADAGQAVRQDCYWSALNFFSTQPSDQYGDAAEVLRTLTQSYYRVYANPQLGDIVEFIDEDDSGRHSAVYIADDFVFTRNGVASSRPWMLMKLEELKDYYPSRKPFEIRFHRRKDL